MAIKKDAVILLGMGGPDSIHSIQTFLKNLFSDRDIIDFRVGNLGQKILSTIISKKRAKKIAPEYNMMGMPNGGSPQNYYNNKLIELLPKMYLEKNGVEADFILGMCYFSPYIEDTIQTVLKGDYRKIILLPLYPHYSDTTTGTTLKRVTRSNLINKAKYEKLIIINEWYDNSIYNDAVVRRIENAAKKLSCALKDVFVLFSAHSIPLVYLEKGDTYQKSVVKHVDMIVNELQLKKYAISYQSKVGPVKWLAPSTKDTLNNLKDKGIDNVVVVPISFISDHIETLIEIDHQLINDYKKADLNIVRSESLNEADDFLHAIIDIIS